MVAGGHCTFNPEPLADFVDLFVIGDGEEVVGEITERSRLEGRGARRARAQAVLRALARIPGVYVPSLYDVAYDGPALVAVTPRYPDVPAVVEKRTIADLAAWPYPKQQLVPMTEVVHDRLNVEIFRGCTRGCRFCQAGHDHPAGPGAAGGQVRQMVRDGLRAHRLRRGQPDVAVDAPTIAASTRPWPGSSTTRPARARSR